MRIYGIQDNHHIDIGLSKRIGPFEYEQTTHKIIQFSAVQWEMENKNSVRRTCENPTILLSQ